MRHAPWSALMLLAACAKQVPPQPPAPAPGATPALSEPAGVPPGWLGRWQGPEGTYLEIATTTGSYAVTIANLDGPRTFAAVPVAGSLAFERDGVRETLHPTDGPGTGMKWLAERHDCLTVRAGEGYCRD